MHITGTHRRCSDGTCPAVHDTASPSLAQALHLRTTPAAPALARCAVLRAAVAAKLAVCRWKQ